MESPSVGIWGLAQERKALKISCRFNPFPNRKVFSSRANELHPSTLLQTVNSVYDSE